MREVFAVVQVFFTKLEGLNESSLFLQIPAYGFLRTSIGIATLASGELRKLPFLFGREVYFHTLRFALTYMRSRKCELC
jgi:hypothetical protein